MFGLSAPQWVRLEVQLLWTAAALGCVLLAAYGGALGYWYVLLGGLLVWSALLWFRGVWHWQPLLVYALVFALAWVLLGGPLSWRSVLGTLGVWVLGLFTLYVSAENGQKYWLESTMHALEVGVTELAQAPTPDVLIRSGAEILSKLGVAPHFAIIAYREGSPVILGASGGFLPFMGHKFSPQASARQSLQSDQWFVKQAVKLLPETEQEFQHLVGVYGRGAQQLGAILLARSERPFSNAERSVAEAFAWILGAQLGQLLAVRELREANDLTLLSLGAALEQRDNETSGHTLRVVTLSVRLAEQLGWAPERVQALRWGSYLHDLGKIAIPDSILHKTGQLSDTERTKMQAHAQLGYEMLQDLHFLPAETLAVVRYHHERWDGSGYPLGLSGSDIPEAARIFALVDVYDALTHARPYKRAWTQQEALAEIQRQAGTHFDPDYVATFCQMMSNDADLMVTA